MNNGSHGAIAMQDRIFLAGATGAIGTALIPCCARRLRGARRHPQRRSLRGLEAAGATPVVVDVFDSAALRTTLARIRPRHVMHQLTDLALLGDPPAPARPRGAMRASATKARATGRCGAGRRQRNAGGPEHRLDLCAAGGPPCDEEQALDLDAQGDRRVSVMGVVALERQVLGAPGITGTVLRYGRLYGPGTGATARPATNALHVEDAAWAALLALRHGGGVFNIAEDESEVSTARARVTLGWRPGMSGLPAIAA